MRIELGTFAREGLEGHLGDDDVRLGVQTALSHYLGTLRSLRRPLAVPRFSEGGAVEPAISIEIPVDAASEALLEREASRQGTTVGGLAAHSVLVYLATLDLCVAPASVSEAAD